MATLSSGELPLASDHDVVLCRRELRRLTQELGFSLVDQTKMVTAASELARNAVVHGGGGEFSWQIRSEGARRGLRATFRDRGPGIPDMALAMRDGWTTGSGLGLGLSGARRLVNEFEIESTVGVGTRVTITRWKS